MIWVSGAFLTSLISLAFHHLGFWSLSYISHISHFSSFGFLEPLLHLSYLSLFMIWVSGAFLTSLISLAFHHLGFWSISYISHISRFSSFGFLEPLLISHISHFSSFGFLEPLLHLSYLSLFIIWVSEASLTSLISFAFHHLGFWSPSYISHISRFSWFGFLEPFLHLSYLSLFIIWVSGASFTSLISLAFHHSGFWSRSYISHIFRFSSCYFSLSRISLVSSLVSCCLWQPHLQHTQNHFQVKNTRNLYLWKKSEKVVFNNSYYYDPHRIIGSSFKIKQIVHFYGLVTFRILLTCMGSRQGDVDKLNKMHWAADQRKSSVTAVNKDLGWI